MTVNDSGMWQRKIIDLIYSKFTLLAKNPDGILE